MSASRPVPIPDIDTTRCTGCGWCVPTCHLHLLSLERQGWEKFAVLSRAEDCTGCTKCAVRCPFEAITMRKTPAA